MFNLLNQKPIVNPKIPLMRVLVCGSKEYNDVQEFKFSHNNSITLGVIQQLLTKWGADATY